ncbi:hypothetical protein CLOM_g5354 [Closterium sp. NIES-68]|nr:hypothetical protein CLOM_g5354 [Closterium sp. NIES-68]GJP80741.1 hypothetical protein CLOP_g10943 [Closterium sp. NIES-67]
MASRTAFLPVLLLLAASLPAIVKPAEAQISIPGVNLGSGGISTTNPGSVTAGGTQIFSNGTFLGSDGQQITPTVNPDGSATAGGVTVYPNGTVTNSDGTVVTLPGGVTIGTGGLQTPGVTVNPDGTVTVNAPKPAGFLASPVSAATGLVSLLSALLFFA